MAEGERMKRIRLLLTVAIGAVAMLPSKGHALTGNEIYSMCKVGPINELNEHLVCAGYLTAVSDMLANRNVVNGFVACIPNTLGNGQGKDVVVKWLRDNPQVRHYPALSLVAQAWSEAFPCK